MAIKTDDQARAAIARLLAKPVNNPGPTWLEVVDLCLWAKQQLTKPKGLEPSANKPKRTDYWRNYKRIWRAKTMAK